MDFIRALSSFDAMAKPLENEGEFDWETVSSRPASSCSSAADGADTGWFMIDVAPTNCNSESMYSGLQDTSTRTNASSSPSGSPFEKQSATEERDQAVLTIINLNGEPRRYVARASES